MLKSKALVWLIVLILLAGNIFFGVKYLAVRRDLAQAQKEIEQNNLNGKILAFTKLFIEKVLKAEQEVDFETRLEMETAVRDLKDSEILAQWQRFTDSQTEAEAQASVKDLFGALINKIQSVK